MEKFVFILLLVLNLISNSFASEGGLYFLSKEVSAEQRTGLDIGYDGGLKYVAGFEFKFKLQFRSSRHGNRYGYLLRLVEENTKNSIDIVCRLDHKSPDIYIVSDQEKVLATLTLSPEHYENKNRWYEAGLNYNAKNQKLTFQFEGNTIIADLLFPDKGILRGGFGVVNQYGFSTLEVPPMNLKDVEFDGKEGDLAKWSLYKTEGKFAKDVLKQKKAELINPNWMSDLAGSWEILFEGEFNTSPQLTYNTSTQEIFLVFHEKLLKYSLTDYSLDTVFYLKGAPFAESNHQLIVKPGGHIVSYSHNAQELSVFEWDSLSWSIQAGETESLPHYWHHNKYFDECSSSIVCLFGYGYFEYKNTIQSNSGSNGWDQISFSGDTIFPRYLSSLKKPDENGKAYVFGGVGNEEGDQILGRKFFYDLFEIDFHNLTISKLWEFQEAPAENFSLVNSMCSGINENQLYSVAFINAGEKTILQAASIDLNKPKVEFLGERLEYVFQDTRSFADAFYWPQENRLVLLSSFQNESNKQVIRICSMPFPPASKATELANVNSALWWWIIILLLGGVLVGILMRRKRPNALQEELPGIPIKRVELKRKNAIYLFGNFEAFDKESKDISYRFSPTVKELFVLILVHNTILSNAISSKVIQESIWPEKGVSRAKNNQGVNMKKLREILSDIEGVEVVFENSLWHVQFTQEAHCDLKELWSLLEEETALSHEKLVKLLGIIEKGKFLVNVEVEWLDSFKEKLSNKLCHGLEKALANKEVLVPEFIIRICDGLFMLDPMNELALKSKCKVLVQLGQHYQAKECYELFVKRFFLLYNEAYSQKFKKIIE